MATSFFRAYAVEHVNLAGWSFASLCAVKPFSHLALLRSKAPSYNPTLRAFYLRLLAVGKAEKLALTAAMRKLLVTLNAILRDRQPWRAPQPA